MVKFIVYWVLVYTIPTSCPISTPAPDKFGRVPEVTIVTTQACFEDKIEKHSREFKTRDSAFAFYTELVKESKIEIIPFDMPVIRDIRLDSVRTKK
jgi:hypothetical protein